jgi:hypothetical protein
MGPFNETKFRELVLYIAHKSEGDPRFDAVKLNKLLYYSDFNAYRRLGRPITNATYQKLSEGPAPKEMLPQRRIMLDKGDITIEHRPYFNGVQQRLVALRPPQKGLFNAEELAIADEMIEAMWHMTASEASAFAQRELGWLAARPGEEIPYQTAWLSSEPLPQEAEEYAREVVAKRGRR